MSQHVVSIEHAIKDIRAGKMIILVDDEDRENEGDLCCAAELVTPELVKDLADEGRQILAIVVASEKTAKARKDARKRPRPTNKA